ncbi:MAG TPA: FGGY-family carbohydrate kinase [Anaeromyxobacter sp.]|nr:FGGY-family carbohydrate kinase [Anaeromyxobacter sp.]
MPDCLLGIDYGTGGAKAALIDVEGTLRGYAFEEYPILTARPGWSEHDAAQYWPVACRLIRRCLAEAKVSGREVRGVAASSALPSLVMVDRQGQPVERAYNLMDRRAQDEVRWLKEQIGEARIFEVTKNRLDDHPVIVNLLWERRHRPDSFARLAKALSIDGYLTLKLTGVASAHYSGAAFYGVAYDLLRRRFDGALLEQLSLDPAFFPPLHSCEDVVGTVTPAAAAETGLAPGTPVAAGQVDCCAGWMGAGMTEPGDVQMNLGTCGNFGVLHREKIFHQSMIAFEHTTGRGEIFITVPTTTTGGGLIRYMRDNFYPAELAAERGGGPDAYDVINREAESAPPGSEGLVVLPFLMGERTPIWDVNARGTVFGLSLQHTRGHLLRAMMESVAYALYDSYRIIQTTGLELRAPIVLNEGGAKSVLWRRIITDVFGVRTALVKRRAGAPWGDAILAGVATGVFKDFDVAKRWSEFTEPLEPDPRRHALYGEYFALYKALYTHVADDFKALARLRDRAQN